MKMIYSIKKKSKINNQFDENILNLINEVNSCLPHKKIFANIQSPNSDKTELSYWGLRQLESKRAKALAVLKAISQIQTEILKNFMLKTKKLILWTL